MKISLIHPSRGRANKALETRDTWMSMSGYDNVNHVISIDFDDPEFNKYQSLFWGDGPRSSVCMGHNKSVVEATNNAILSNDDKPRGDILVYLSDDFKCPDNWGQLILKEFEGVTEPMLLHVDDCLQPMHARVLTIPIMNRQLYNKLGYFFHPEYKSMWVDCDLYETCDRLRVIKKAPHLKFPHEHVSVGKAPDDETYRNSAKNWDQGNAVFAKRKAAGFPI